MARIAALRCRDMLEEFPPVEEEIRAFLDGETNGEPLLHALYDHILDEPIPARLLGVLRG